MSRIFLTVLNMSLTAGYCIAAVIVLRFFLKKQPKIFSYLLWSVVLFRLLCPFSISSSYSLLRVNTDLLSSDIIGISNTDDAGEKVQDTAIAVAVQGTESGTDISAHSDDDTESAGETWRKVIAVGAWVWLTGILALVLYSIGTVLRLRRSLANAVLTEGNQYEAEGIATPFVMGICRPRIYLPVHLQQEEKRYVLAHEKIHIARKDYLVKITFYTAVCIHWFNPLAWLAFVLMENDMEMSCDETVLKKLGPGVKKEYSRSLLSLSTGESRFWSSPLAFGEGNVKGRVRNILAYRKRTALAIVAVAAALIVVGAGLLLNPVRDKEADVEEETQRLAAFVEDYAEAFCSRNGERIVNFFMDEETALGSVYMLEKEDDMYTLGLSNPWPLEFRYQLIPEEGRAYIYYYAWTSDPHIYVWRENIQCLLIDGGYLVAEDFYWISDRITTKEEFDSVYLIEDVYQFVDYRENGFVDAINYQREDGTSSVDNTVYAEPIRAAEHILNLSGGTGRLDGQSVYQVTVWYTFADGSEVMIPMYQANYDAATETSTDEPLWVVDTAVWNAGAP